MTLSPGTPLDVRFRFDEESEALPVARLAMADGRAQLEWAQALLVSGLAPSPLLYPPSPGLHAARSREFEGLHGFLAESLPEDWGQLVLRRRLARLGVRFETLSSPDRLALVGDSGRGALTYRPATTPPAEQMNLDLDRLQAEATAVILGEDTDLIDTLAALAGGSGGARPKVHVGFGADGRISVSDSETAAGHEAWIVKFRAPQDPVDIGPIEAAYADMAIQAGLTMSAHRLLPARQGPGYFATRRFDRPQAGQRLHMISLGGALEIPWRTPSSYDTLLRATLAITRHASDVESAFRRMVFNILACNRDDHVRQHSFLMDRHGQWRLSPAYDLTFSTGPGGEHYLDVEGKGRNPNRRHVMALGKRHGFSTTATSRLIDEVRCAIADWPLHAAQAGVTRASKTEITAAHKAVEACFFAT
ncbi:HipA domain-containing protein [Asticcacaulis sp. DXS10W]|uniref:HipA domain-containing protein n=1 Tax=Asticcacaulis currens TaxID=2984210 RepID=A0ABT5I963_9CAUL|nr:HipA domain-containing protein [Asticcacaulis currens]MDC7692730.1 HipA domain-containing protein [Asticcacaulis currens]